uniref:Uncharacterized protein n=1 Tax=Vitis vinifera TaxID=29760 RepID=A5C372_VITVI|nr:hypothetical protein VITISV_015782 [Vitis vinifera]
MASRLRNSRSALRACLQTTITSSFHLRITYHLKRWTPNFPSFETRYGMYNLSSRKYFKNVSNSSKMEVRHFRSWFAQSFSNGHNFSVSNPNRAPFEAMDSHFRSYEMRVLFCEMALVCQNRLSSCETPFQMELSLRNGAPVLRSGTRVPKLVLHLQKFSQRGQLGCELVSQQSIDFAEAAKSRRPLFFPCFLPVFAPILLRKTSFNFFTIPLDFDHPKTYITSKQTRIKALKSKLKH